MAAATVKTYSLPAAFYDDHVARDCEAGRLVKRTSRGVLVELDVVAWLDLESDADYYANPATAGDMAECSGIGAYGLARSAAATRRRLLADPFTADELEAGRAEWSRRQAKQAERDRVAQAAAAERYAAERAERERLERDHPTIIADYTGRPNADGVPTVLGVDAERYGRSVRVGAVVRADGRSLELVEAGDYFRGDVPAIGRDRDTGTLVELRLELCGRVDPATIGKG